MHLSKNRKCRENDVCSTVQGVRGYVMCKNSRVKSQSPGIEAIKQTSGFTLIELLVVISILALLLSIILPSLGRAKEIARRTVCKSNLKQRGVVERCYASDFKGNLIPSYAQTDYAKQAGVVPYLMYRDTYNYLKQNYGLTPEFLMCPSLHTQRDRVGELGSQHPHLQIGNEAWIEKKWRRAGELMPYWGNSLTQELYVVPGYYLLAHLVDIKAAASFPKTVPESPVKITDSGNKHLSADLNVMWLDWNYGESASAHREKPNSAPAGGNRLYLDGHVEWVKPERMGYKDQPITRDPRSAKYTWALGVRWCFW